MYNMYMYIYNEIGRRRLPAGTSWAEGARAGATSAELGDRPGRPGWLDRPKSNGFDRFGWLRPAKVDRKGRPSDRKGDLGSILRRFLCDFRCFSRSLRASESMCSSMGRTSVFADRCGTSEGSHALRKRQNTTKRNDKSQRRSFSSETRRQNSKFSIPEAAWH